MTKCAICGTTDKRLYRPYGEFRRPENDRCNRCLAFMQLPRREWYVPLITDENGDAWGYTSIPYQDVQQFDATPEACWWGPRWLKSDEWQAPSLLPILSIWVAVVVLVLLCA